MSTEYYYILSEGYDLWTQYVWKCSSNGLNYHTDNCFMSFWIGIMHNEMDNYECGTQVSRPEMYSNANGIPVSSL